MRDHLKELEDARRELAHLREQAMLSGRNVPHEIFNELLDRIARLKSEIKRLEAESFLYAAASIQNVV